MNFVNPDAIRELDALEEGWNGGGEKPPTLEALRVLHSVAVVPVSDGGLQIEIHAGGFDVEIGIEPDGRIGDFYIARAEDG